MRLIDYDAAIDCYYAEYEKQDICDGSQDRDYLKRCFDEAPTVEAAPVVHGMWVESDIPGSMLSKCTVCGFRCGAYTFNFCPNCGAKMDLNDGKS